MVNINVGPDDTGNDRYNEINFYFGKIWEARLETLPKGMPKFFADAKFITDGLGGSSRYFRDNTHPPEDPINLQFIRAYYETSPVLSYGCLYFATNFRERDLLVSLKLSETRLPTALKGMLLLVKPYGNEWTTSHDLLLKTCRKSAAECTFDFPREAITKN